MAKDHHTFDLSQPEWDEILDLMPGLVPAVRGEVQTTIRNVVRWALFHESQWRPLQYTGEVRKQLERIQGSASELLAVATELGLATMEERAEALGERRSLEEPTEGREQRMERSAETLFLLGSLGQPALARVMPELRKIRNSANIALDRIAQPTPSESSETPSRPPPLRLPSKGPQSSGAPRMLVEYLAHIWELYEGARPTSTPVWGGFSDFAQLVLQKSGLPWSDRTIWEALRDSKNRRLYE
jgi:hypothetical protein